MTADYGLDPVGAHRRYRDKTFEIEGYVFLTFTEAPHPHPAVSLVDEPTNPTNPALVRLKDATLIKLLQGIQGEFISVVLSAKCSGYSDNMLQFKDGTLVAPSAKSVEARISELVGQNDVAGVKAAQKHLDLMTSLGIVTSEEAKSLSSRITDAKTALVNTAREHWVPLIRQHIERQEFDEAEQAIKSAEAELLDVETAKTLRDELGSARAEQEKRLAGLLTTVRENIVSADYEAARTAVAEASKSGDLDASTEKSLRGEIETAETVRNLLTDGKPHEAAKSLLDKAKALSETVREALSDEVSTAMAAFEKQAKETEDSIRQSMIDGKMEEAATALKKASDDGVLSKAVVTTLATDGAAAEVVRSKLKADDVLGATSALKAVKGMSATVRSALEGEISAKLDELKAAAKATAIQKIKLKDGTDVTLDFTCIADTTRVDSVQITTEDTTGFTQYVYVKVKFTHFAVVPDTFRPRMSHQSMSREVHLSETGEASLSIEKAKIKDKEVKFELK